MGARRAAIIERIKEASAFFREVGALDDEVYSEGEIGIKNKELIGSAVSIVTRCDERVLNHLDESRNEDTGRKESVETIKIGVVADGSIAFPNARFAFAALDNGGA